jgi:hypothetical protein
MSPEDAKNFNKNQMTNMKQKIAKSVEAIITLLNSSEQTGKEKVGMLLNELDMMKRATLRVSKSTAETRQRHLDEIHTADEKRKTKAEAKEAKEERAANTIATAQKNRIARTKAKEERAANTIATAQKNRIARTKAKADADELRENDKNDNSMIARERAVRNNRKKATADLDKELTAIEKADKANLVAKDKRQNKSKVVIAAKPKAVVVAAAKPEPEPEPETEANLHDQLDGILGNAGPKKSVSAQRRSRRIQNKQTAQSQPKPQSPPKQQSPPKPKPKPPPKPPKPKPKK